MASLAAIAALAGTAVVAAPAVAQDTVPVEPATSICRGTAVKTGNLILLPNGLNIASANNQESPCVEDHEQVIGLNVPVNSGPLAPLKTLLGINTGNLLFLSVLESATFLEPNNNGTSAVSRVAYAQLNVLGLNIVVGALESHARARVDDCQPSQFGYSHVAQLNINGKFKYAGYQPATIPLGIGTIYLNQQTRQGDDTLTQRAVFIDLPGDALDISLGESKAGASCGSGPVVELPDDQPRP